MAIPQGLLEGINNLDPLPITVQKLVSCLGEEDADLQEVAQVIEYDPAVAANILRVANSALYAGRTRIVDPRDAVVRLGTSTLLTIILGGYLKDLTVSAPLYRLEEDELWLHSAVSAIAARAIGKRSGRSKSPQSAVIAALVHDVGKLIMVRYLKAEVDDLLKLCRRDGLTFVEAERALFGCDHAEVGAAIGRRWAFPSPIVEAIERHHQVPIRGSSGVLDTVVVANLVAKTIGIGLGAEGLNLKFDEGCRERLGLDFGAFCRLCAETASQVSELRRAYGLQS